MNPCAIEYSPRSKLQLNPYTTEYNPRTNILNLDDKIYPTWNNLITAINSTTATTLIAIDGDNIDSIVELIFTEDNISKDDIFVVVYYRNIMSKNRLNKIMSYFNHPNIAFRLSLTTFENAADSMLIMDSYMVVLQCNINTTIICTNDRFGDELCAQLQSRNNQCFAVNRNHLIKNRFKSYKANYNMMIELILNYPELIYNLNCSLNFVEELDSVVNLLPDYYKIKDQVILLRYYHDRAMGNKYVDI